MTQNRTDDEIEEYSQRTIYAGNMGEEHLDLLNTVTQETRYVVLLDILAHPEQAPSLRELDYLQPDTGRTTIADHLDELIEWGVVEKQVIPKGKRDRPLPHVFFTISKYGREFINLHELVPLSLEEMRADYSRIEKSEEVERYEDAPREDAVVITDDRDEEKFQTLYRVVQQQDTSGFSLRCVLGFHSWKVSAVEEFDGSGKVVEEKCERCGETRSR